MTRERKEGHSSEHMQAGSGCGQGRNLVWCLARFRWGRSRRLSEIEKA